MHKCSQAQQFNHTISRLSTQIKMKNLYKNYIKNKQTTNLKMLDKHRSSFQSAKLMQKFQIKYSSSLVKIKNNDEPRYFVFNNKNNQKVITKMEIRNIEEFLKIQKANLFQKKVPISGIMTPGEDNYSKFRYSRLSMLAKRQSMLKEMHANQIAGLGELQAMRIDEENQARNVFRAAFEYRLNKYLDISKQNSKKSQLSFKKIDKYEQNSLTFYIERGNNSSLIEQSMNKRWWWHQEPRNTQEVNFNWTQVKKRDLHNIRNAHVKLAQKSFSKSSEVIPQSIYLSNHFEFNQYLTSRIALYEIAKQPTHLPLKIPKMYYIHHGSSDLSTFKREHFNDTNKTHNILLNYLFEYKLLQPKLWLVKRISSEHSSGMLKIMKNYEQIEREVSSPLREQSFIIEQYISHPFLYKKRKMLIKVFVLITNLNQKLQIYWYKDGYIALATEEYKREDINNPYRHFTSENIQIHHPNFGEQEISNKLSFLEFQQYLSEECQQKKYSFHDTIQKMKQNTQMLISRVHSKLQESSMSSFQLFEMNYILDEQFIPWLLSIHTNPFLQETSPILANLIPNMIDDIFKLTVDLVAPPPLKWPRKKMYLVKDSLLENGFQQMQSLSAIQSGVCFSRESLIEDEQKYYEKIQEETEPCQ